MPPPSASTKSTARNRTRTRRRRGSWPIEQVLGRLEPLYGPPEPPRRFDPVSELVYTILSQHTSDANSVPAYRRLVDTLPTWDAVADAPTAVVADAIRVGGLAQIKAPRVQAVLRELRGRLGGFDLSFLGGMPLEEAKAWLRELPGVGPKTVGCVLMFSMGMPALPVDTHVYRVAQRLGLYGPSTTPDQSHDVLESMVAPEERLPFHMYLITHGRRVCKAMRPACGECVLEERCPSSTLKGAGRRQGTESRRRATQKARG